MKNFGVIPHTVPVNKNNGQLGTIGSDKNDRLTYGIYDTRVVDRKSPI